MANSNSTFRMRFDPEAKTGKTGVSRADAAALIKDLSPFRLRLAAFFAATAGAAWTFSLLPGLIGEAVDLFASVLFSSVITGEVQADPAAAVSILLRAGVLFAANAVFGYLQGALSAGTASAYAHRLRCRVFAQITRVRMAWFDLNPAQSALGLATEEIDRINQDLNVFLSQGVDAFAMLLAIFIAMFRSNPVTGLLFLPAIPATLLLSKALPQPDPPADKRQTRPDEIYRHIGELRLSGAAPQVLAEAERYERETAAWLKKSRRSAFLRRNLPALILGVLLAVSVLFDLRRIGRGVSLGALISLIFYASKLELPLSRLTLPVSVGAELVRSSAGLFAFLRVPAESRGAGNLPLPPDGADLTVEGLTFRYPAGTADVLRDFSAVIPKRGVTVLSGPTGAGKTTLVQLLLRFYLPQGGVIRFGETPVEAFDLKAYRAAFSVIGQEALLFDATLAQNICYPDEEADPTRLHEAAGIAGASKTAEALPLGFDTPLAAEETALSAGQLQQILLARAVYHESRFIILDEATSGIDPAQEARFFERLKALAQTRAVILISHRPGAEAWADTVIDVPML